MGLPILKWEKINSTNIKRTSWIPEEDPEADGGNMYVDFHSGWMYVYFEVPSEVYDAFKKAPSRGKFHAQHIKWKYDYSVLNKKK